MTQNNAHDRDEERLATLLRVVDADVPPPDRKRVDTLREQSAKLFGSFALLPVPGSEQTGEPAGVSPRTESMTPEDRPVAGAYRLTTETSQLRSPMLTLALAD